MSLKQFGRLRFQFPGRVRVGNCATLDEIRQAEHALGVAFSLSYLRFLALYGWAEIGCFQVYGIGAGVPEHLNIVSNTIGEREEFEPHMPHHLIPVMNDGSGNHYCLDSSCANADDEMPIVFWDHESPAGESQMPKAVAPTFEHWLYERAKFLLE